MSQEIVDKVIFYYEKGNEYLRSVEIYDKAYLENFVNACVALETADKTPVLTNPFKPLSEDQIRQDLVSLANFIKTIKPGRSHDLIIQAVSESRQNIDAYLSTQQLTPDEAKQIKQAFKDLTQCYFGPPENHRKDEDHLRMIAFFLDDWDHLLDQD